MRDAPIVSLNPHPRNPKASARVGWVVAGNGCHIWQGYVDTEGYGRVRVACVGFYVHRFRYEREVGPIPSGMVLDHFACDTRACCNPSHVRPVTHRENILRGNTVASMNAAKTHCKRGHLLGADNVLPSDCALGLRTCRECRRVVDRARSARQKTARTA